jgi:hypothetical protein
MQYGRYLTASDDYGTKPFVFKKSSNISSIPKVTFQELTFWILMSGRDSNARRHAQAWDNAIRLNVAHRRSLTLPDWDKFLQAAAVLQFKK